MCLLESVTKPGFTRLNHSSLRLLVTQMHSLPNRANAFLGRDTSKENGVRRLAVGPFSADLIRLADIRLFRNINDYSVQTIFPWIASHYLF
jgi:hypothetical protein